MNNKEKPYIEIWNLDKPCVFFYFTQNGSNKISFTCFFRYNRNRFSADSKSAGFCFRQYWKCLKWVACLYLFSLSFRIQPPCGVTLLQLLYTHIRRIHRLTRTHSWTMAYHHTSVIQLYVDRMESSWATSTTHSPLMLWNFRE